MMRIDKSIDDIVRTFTLEILENKNRIAKIEQQNKEKEAFLKAIKQKIQLKYSELFYALELDSLKYWKISERMVEGFKSPIYEIKVYKKYFLNTNQIEIVERHYVLKYSTPKAYIRIIQFY